jgi:hypothetical protein
MHVTSAPVEIEILHTHGCGNWRTVRDSIGRIAGELGIAVAISDVEVRTPEMAQALRFPGSPTVRVRGRDIEPRAGVDQDFGLG